MAQVAPSAQAIGQPPAVHDISHDSPSGHTQMSLGLHVISVAGPPPDEPPGTLQSSAHPEIVASAAIHPNDLAGLVRIIVPGPW